METKKGKSDEQLKILLEEYKKGPKKQWFLKAISKQLLTLWIYEKHALDASCN
jgi:hypothetical protein